MRITINCIRYFKFLRAFLNGVTVSVKRRKRELPVKDIFIILVLDISITKGMRYFKFYLLCL